MILELTMLGAGASYWLKQRQGRNQQRARLVRSIIAHTEHTEEARQSVDVRQLLRDIHATLAATDQQRLHIELDPQLQQAKKQAQLAASKRMRLSVGALGVTTMAALCPIFIPVGIFALLYLSQDIYKLIWKDFKRGHYLSFYLIGAVMNLGMIVTGHLILSAFSSVMFGFFARITNQLESASQSRLISVFSNHPPQVWIIKEGVEIQVDFHTLQEGDQVVVNTGEVIPVDGKVIAGLGRVDQHMLTGESQPVDKEPSDEVLASTLLISGRLTIEVTTAGDKTVAAQISKLLNQTQSHKDMLVMRGRKLGDRYIPVKFGLASLALPLLGPNAAMAVMWANLGNGLSTAVPILVLTYLRLLAQQNILVKDGRIFESLRQVDTVVFDKTGTLTEEQPTLGRIHGLNGFAEREVLRLAAAAEYRQPHPVAQAILVRAAAEQLDLPVQEEASYEVGYGIKVSIEGRLVQIGSARFLQQEGIEFSETVASIQQQAEEDSYSLVYVSVDGQLAGILEIEPTIRPEAQAMVQVLKQRGLEVYIISGDHETPTRRLAEKLGIDHYFAETLPENKANLVQQLKDEGRFVCFVGDGINDAIALKTAQISISLKGASTAATDTAQIVFMDGTLKHLTQLFERVDEFKEIMRRAVVIDFTPGIVTIAGVFFWHFGVAISLIILYLNILLGIGNILWPLVRQQQTLLGPVQGNEEDAVTVRKNGDGNKK